MCVIRNPIYNDFSYLKKVTIMHSYSFIQQYLLCTYYVPVTFLGIRDIMNKISQSLTLPFVEGWRWETENKQKKCVKYKNCRISATENSKAEKGLWLGFLKGG